MVDYKMVSITPKLKSQLKKSGKRSVFTVWDCGDNSYVCYNKYLYDAIQEGRAVEIRINDRTPPVISGVTGFKYNLPVPKNRAPINPSEKELFELMSDNGWELTKRGWPDFACFKDGKLVLIEVKPKRSHKLKYWQHKIMLELVKHDIKCYRWSPDGGFEPIVENVKFPIDLP